MTSVSGLLCPRAVDPACRLQYGSNMGIEHFIVERSETCQSRSKVVSNSPPFLSASHQATHPPAGWATGPKQQKCIHTADNTTLPWIRIWGKVRIHIMKSYVDTLRQQSIESETRRYCTIDADMNFKRLVKVFGSEHMAMILEKKPREQILKELFEAIFLVDLSKVYKKEILPYVHADYVDKVKNTTCATGLFRRPNAWAIKVPPNDVGILFTFELESFIEIFNTVITSLFYTHIRGDRDEIVESLFKGASVVGLRIAQMELGLPVDAYLEFEFPDKYFKNVIREWTRIQMCFVTAHEFGHVALDHLDLSKLLEETIEGLPEKIHRYDTFSDTELQADKFACDVVCKPESPEQEVSEIYFQPPTARSIAVDILFSCFDLYDFMCHEIIGIKKHALTHPSAEERRKHFREYCVLDDDRAFETVSEVERLVGVLKRILMSEREGFLKHLGVS